MPIPDPPIDDRRYREIFAEAKARIAVHNPEWTNANDSDPGITLLQLFSFMVESMLYRANRVPERNRKKFLRLLGIEMQPAEAARGIVAFSNPRGELVPHVLDEALELFAGSVPFRTRNALEVLPIEIQVYTKANVELTEGESKEIETLYAQLYASFDEDGGGDDEDLGARKVKPQLYRTTLLELPSGVGDLPVVDLTEDTVDGYLWIAVLARTADDVETTRKEIQNRELTLGIVPIVSDEAKVLPAGDEHTAQAEANLHFERPVVEVVPADQTPPARYEPLDATVSGDLLQTPGVVRLKLPDVSRLTTWSELDPLEAGVGSFPPTPDDTAVAERLVTWIRVRPGRERSTEGSPLQARFSVIVANAAEVTQRAHVVSELVGRGTGESDQSFALVNTPVIPSTVQLAVNGELWSSIDDLAAAAPEIVRDGSGLPTAAGGTSDDGDAKVYTVDRESGVITFGDGLRGARPAVDAVIQASYDYGGGLEGLVGIGAIAKGPVLPSGVKVSNPVPTWGADAAESVADAERNIPAHVRHRDRLVSEQDFVDITRRTPGVDVGRVEVLPLYDRELDSLGAAGVVTVLVIPASDPVQPDAPVPDVLFLDTVCRYLNPRRLITTELHVTGPDYRSVYVSVGIDVVAGEDTAPVRERVKQRVRAFLSPLTGGFDGTGWPLDRPVESVEILTVVARVRGVSRVNEVLVANAEGIESSSIELDGIELPRLEALTVLSGDAQPVTELLGREDEPQPERLPIPFVPEEC